MTQELRYTTTETIIEERPLLAGEWGLFRTSLCDDDVDEKKHSQTAIIALKNIGYIENSYKLDSDTLYGTGKFKRDIQYPSTGPEVKAWLTSETHKILCEGDCDECPAQMSENTYQCAFEIDNYSLEVCAEILKNKTIEVTVAYIK